jgi:hypothetical protein
VVDANSRLYLFLRARVQAEGYRNRDSALNYLRALLRTRPNDEEALAYYAKLLLESPRPEETSEGRAVLARLVASGSQSPVIADWPSMTRSPASPEGGLAGGRGALGRPPVRVDLRAAYPCTAASNLIGPFSCA